MNRVLPKKFFHNKNTTLIAKNLLGKFLVRRYRKKIKAYLITEIEAYDGPKDKASHAHRGKTERNKIMFGPAGCWYVYFTYGMHWMLNIVTGPKNYPAAVLIRSVIPSVTPMVTPKQFIQLSSSSLITGYNGPGRLTKALNIDKKMNGKIADKKSGLWIEDMGVKIRPSQIKKGLRIGVAYAGPTWSKKKWRFYI
ncbi:MAG: DNA-3-methyladenine glycosylase [Candidatus Harrisonbacteria bacterium]|nr:DNA-3-methyladenine glycosylase [Candidatus Harrisonbacteria bacterium]